MLRSALCARTRTRSLSRLPAPYAARHPTAACCWSSACHHRQLSSSSSPNPPKDEPKPSRWQQLKTTFREYGPIFVGYYGATWLGGFAVCYGGVTLYGLDGVELLNWVGADQLIDTSALSPTLVNALIAGEINELFDWVRLPLVIATTPALARRLRGGGGTVAAAVAKEATKKTK